MLFALAWHRPLGLFALVGLLLSALMMGCVEFQYGGGSRQLSEPIRVPAEAPVPTPVVGKEFSRPQRLVLPTFTPVPSPTPPGLFELSADSPDEAGPVRPAVGPAVTASERFDFVQYGTTSGVWSDPGPGGLVGCVDVFRRSVLAYEGRAPFGPEVAQSLSDQLLRSRPDCADAGWAPVFALEPVCVVPFFADRRLPDTLIFFQPGARYGVVRASMKDPFGNVVIHFSRMPLVDGLGCWHFAVYDGSWTWFSNPLGEGIDYLRFPHCEAALRGLIAPTLGQPVRPLEVLAFMDSVRVETEGCVQGGWEPFPQGGGYPACGGRATGWHEGGEFVLNWHESYLASGGDVCWVYKAAEDEWMAYTGGALP